MGQFDAILDRLVQWGQRQKDVQALLVIGSQARTDAPADAFSDLDLVVCVDDPERYLYQDEWLRPIGDFYLSFLEDTLDGAKERRILFDGALDVDFVFCTQAAFEALGQSGQGQGILARGYRVLVDKMGMSGMLRDSPAGQLACAPLSEAAFVNLAHDFWYHVIWSAKKLLRGELWAAKGCVDSYLKNRLRQAIECHAQALHGPGYDTWHDGRFLDGWAEPWVVQGLADCYAHYEREDVKAALRATAALFHWVAVEAADKMGYAYPFRGYRYAMQWLQDNL